MNDMERWIYANESCPLFVELAINVNISLNLFQGNQHGFRNRMELGGAISLKQIVGIRPVYIYNNTFRDMSGFDQERLSTA